MCQYTSQNILLATRPLCNAGNVQPKPIAIPSYVPLTLQVASGLQFGTPQDFEHFRQVASNEVKRFERLQIIREGKYKAYINAPWAFKQNGIHFFYPCDCLLL